MPSVGKFRPSTAPASTSVGGSVLSTLGRAGAFSRIGPAVSFQVSAKRPTRNWERRRAPPGPPPAGAGAEPTDAELVEQAAALVAAPGGREQAAARRVHEHEARVGDRRRDEAR